MLPPANDPPATPPANNPPAGTPPTLGSQFDFGLVAAAAGLAGLLAGLWFLFGRRRRSDGEPELVYP
jgi:LPXTG-motif cell wall-anchored protein